MLLRLKLQLRQFVMQATRRKLSVRCMWLSVCGNRLAVSLSSAQLVARLRSIDQIDRLHALVRCASWLFCNQDEFCAYFAPDAPGAIMEQPELMCEMVRANGFAGSVVITQGTKNTCNFAFPVAV